MNIPRSVRKLGKSEFWCRKSCC